MTGRKLKESTRKREGYFLSFVEKLRSQVDVPLCVTGGFRTAPGMAAAVAEDAADMVGLARTLAIQPEFPRQVLAGESPQSLVKRLSTGIKMLDMVSTLDVSWYENQLARMGRGQPPDPELAPLVSVVRSLWSQGSQAFKLRRVRRR